METVYCPHALTITFVTVGLSGLRGCYIRRNFSAHSLHSFKIECSPRSSRLKITAPDGAVAMGVSNNAFERLPAGYVWVKFKGITPLCTAIRDAQLNWNWQCGAVEFFPDRFYAIKIESTEDHDGCHITTKDGKICPHTARRYFDVFREMSKAPRSKTILEAFPAPVPGVQREYEPGVWDVPEEYNSIPVRYDEHLFSRFKHPTIKPVAGLRLDFDSDRNPVYMCSYFGPAPK